MSQETILCPTDFSANSAFALQHAVNYARASGATIIIAHVEEVEDAASGEGMLHSGVQPVDSEQLVERLRAVVPDHDVAYEHRLLKGRPAPEIMSFAAAAQVGMIVIGTHGRSGLSRLILGSVAEQVLREADCTVVAIKTPREE